MYQGKKITAIIAAAGSGKRMGGGISKQYLEIDGERMLVKSLRAFCGHPYIDSVCLVVKEDDLAFCTKLWLGTQGFEKVKSLVPGGKERQDSVAGALAVLAEAEKPDYVLVHDGARPFVTEAEISRLAEAAVLYGAAVPGVPVKDTVKKAVDEFLTETPDRKTLFAIQTPQGFAFDLLKTAYEKAFAEGFYGTDDAQLVERCGGKVRLVAGEYTNRKITTKEDLPTEREWRTGSGIDVHAFETGRKLVLGGVEIPFERGLAGHSDADVLVHAVMDALLGAAGLGDIGEHFPDRDEKWKGISSLVLLSTVADLLADAGFGIGNIDATLIGERPKITPYKEEMKRKLADTLRISGNRINIKGTTTEKLGFCGREEGLAATAAATVFRHAGTVLIK